MVGYKNKKKQAKLHAKALKSGAVGVYNSFKMYCDEDKGTIRNLFLLDGLKVKDGRT